MSGRGANPIKPYKGLYDRLKFDHAPTYIITS